MKFALFSFLEISLQLAYCLWGLCICFEGHFVEQNIYELVE